MQAWTLAVRPTPSIASRCSSGVSPRAWRASGFRVIARDLIAASGFASVHELLNSTAFEVVRNLALFLVVVFWVGLAFWVFRDARRRVDDPLLVGTATLLGLSVPYVGAVIYLLFRPPETLVDARARRVELRALETSLERREPQCPVCRAAVAPAFLVCPVCTTHLKEPCRACKAPLEPLWQVCPYCTTPVKAPAVVDLDAALTAEAASNGSKKAPTKRPRRAAAS